MLSAKGIVISCMLSMCLIISPNQIDESQLKSYIDKQNELLEDMYSEYVDHENRFLLVSEYLENDDPNNLEVSLFTREYREYDLETKQVRPFTSTVAIDKVETISEARAYLREHYPDHLALENNAVVSLNALLEKLKE